MDTRNAIWRLLPNGRIDPSFGNHGFVGPYYLLDVSVRPDSILATRLVGTTVELFELDQSGQELWKLVLPSGGDMMVNGDVAYFGGSWREGHQFTGYVFAVDLQSHALVENFGEGGTALAPDDVAVLLLRKDGIGVLCYGVRYGLEGDHLTVASHHFFRLDAEGRLVDDVISFDDDGERQWGVADIEADGDSWLVAGSGSVDGVVRSSGFVMRIP